MSNNYFQFKQFTVKQEQTAMKVSTDACIQGAWTPVYEHVTNVLDIGTGTGLLSLMLAQRAPNIMIDAIELNANAAAQAAANIAATSWKERINILNADAMNYHYSKRYELVICNPPFFRDSLLGPDGNRNVARHGLSFSYEDLLAIMERVIVDDGYASILLPFKEHAIWEQLLEKSNWEIFYKYIVYPRAEMKPNRIISLCAKKYGKRKQEEKLYIYESPGIYTDGFKKLMQPFYLNL